MFSIVYKSKISFSLAFVAHIRSNNGVNEWSAHGQSDSNLGHKGQAVADTRINRLTRWLTGSVSHLFSWII